MTLVCKVDYIFLTIAYLSCTFMLYLYAFKLKIV